MIDEDIAQIIRQRCPSLAQFVTTDSDNQIRQIPYGIKVRQRETTGTVHHLQHCDEVFVDIIVRGQHDGDVGKRSADEMAQTVYKVMNLVYDTTVNGTRYIRIFADSAPFPVNDGTHFDRQFGLQVLRYIGD